MAQINKPSEYFNTKLYTGDGNSTHAITGVGFQPDWVWIKDRVEVYDHHLFDAVRGGGNSLYSNDNVAENTYTTDISFNSDGFTTAGVGSAAINYVNQSGHTFASWNWKANGAGVSNTAGTITSTVSANPTSGFAIATYTGTGAVDTVGHGLTVQPDFIWVKDRDSVQDWICYTKIIDGSNDYLILNSTAALGNSGFIGTNATVFNFDLGASAYSNTSGKNYIMYSFASVKGYSKIGTYTGNGSTDGTFVYTGFKPAMIIAKNTESTDNWIIMDNKRANTYNPQTGKLLPNDTATEDTTDNVDFLSNGFKLRETSIDSYTINRSGNKIIYMAFAENPLVGTNNIPTTAR